MDTQTTDNNKDAIQITSDAGEQKSDGATGQDKKSALTTEETNSELYSLLFKNNSPEPSSNFLHAQKRKATIEKNEKLIDTKQNEEVEDSKVNMRKILKLIKSQDVSVRSLAEISDDEKDVVNKKVRKMSNSSRISRGKSKEKEKISATSESKEENIATTELNNDPCSSKCRKGCVCKNLNLNSELFIDEEINDSYEDDLSNQKVSVNEIEYESSNDGSDSDYIPDEDMDC
uniref:Protein PFC0760c-like n=1 Tax=Parastrongyloides trichosuri TaxID=131310 RepID=A0A0N4Z7W1_PARTI